VVGGSLHFDNPTTTAAAAAAVESLRRSNSILLRQNSCAKVIQRRGSGSGSPTSLGSQMEGLGMGMGGGGAGSACCSSCCMGPPPVLFLFVTLLMTTSATAMLCAAIMTDHWEHVTWDRNSLDRYTNRSGLHLEWLLDDQVAMLKPDKRGNAKKTSINTLIMQEDSLFHFSSRSRSSLPARLRVPGAHARRHLDAVHRSANSAAAGTSAQPQVPSRCSAMCQLPGRLHGECTR